MRFSFWYYKWKKLRTQWKWPYIPDHSYRILMIGVSGSGKTNTLLNLIKEPNDVGKIYLYAKDLSEPKYEFLIKKCKNAGTKYLNDPNAFIECSNTMGDVYENNDDYNSSRKRKISIVLMKWLQTLWVTKNLKP